MKLLDQHIRYLCSCFGYLRYCSPLMLTDCQRSRLHFHRLRCSQILNHKKNSYKEEREIFNIDMIYERDQRLNTKAVL